MSPIAPTFEIDRPPDVVFSYATDPSRFAEWQHDVVQVRGEGDRPAEVGARFTTTRRIGRAQRTMTQEVTEIDPPRRWAVRGVDGPVRAIVTRDRAPSSRGSMVMVTFGTPPPAPSRGLGGEHHRHAQHPASRAGAQREQDRRDHPRPVDLLAARPKRQ